MSRKLYTAILLYFTFICLSFAQFAELKLKQISQEHGLPGVTVRSILQDSKGLIWMGVESYGLCKYDGYNFEMFSHNPDDSNALCNSVVESLFENTDGNLWIGTQNGLNIYNRNNKSFTLISKLPNNKQSVPGNVIFSIKGNQSHIWIGTDNGLAIFDQTTKFFTHLLYNQSPKISISDIAIDKQNNAWCASNIGLLVFSPDGKLIDSYNAQNKKLPLSFSEIYTIEQISDSTFLLGAKLHLMEINIVRNTFKEISYLDAVPYNTGDYITDIIKDKNNTIWVSTTTEGVSVVSDDYTEYRNYKPDKNFPNGLKSAAVRELYEDQNGLIWLGLKMEGIQIYNYNNQVFTNLQSPLIKPLNKLKGIISLHCTPDNKLIIGTNKNGLASFDLTSGNLAIPEFKNLPELKNARINAITQDLSGNIWFGTAGGLFLCSNNYDAAKKLLSNDIIDIIIDKQNKVWIGTRKGLYLYYNNKITSFSDYTNKKFDLSFEIKTLFEDSLGNIWIGTLIDGLYRYNTNSNTLIGFLQSKPTLKAKHIRSFWEDKNGMVWITTRGDGLYRYSYKQNVFKNFSEKDGLPTNTLFGITEDLNHSLWISSYQGLFSFDYKDFKIQNFTKEYGLKNDIFEPNACCKTADNYLVFGGENGLNFFDPQTLIIQKKPSPLVITSMKVFEKALFTDLDSVSHIELSYAENYISFEFALLDYTTNIGKRYTYKLEGVDNDWIQTKSRNFVSYTNLKPGKYTFLLKGETKDGVTNANNVTVHITINAPFWQKIWFQLVLILTIGLIIYYNITSRLRSARKRNKQLEFLVNDKTADLQKQKQVLEDQAKALIISNEQLKNANITKNTIMSVIAHDLKNQFQSIIYLSSVVVQEAEYENIFVKKTKQIHSSAKSTINILENLLSWYKTQNNDLKAKIGEVNIKKIVSEIINNYALSAIEKQINIEIDIAENILVLADNEMLKAIIRNLYNNALKFTPIQGKITVKAEIVNSQLLFSMADTGCGIEEMKLETLFFFGNVKTESSSGLGLEICKKFCDAMSLPLQVTSIHHEGTKFTITLPLAQNQAVDEVSELLQFDEIDASTLISDIHILKNKKILLIDDNSALLQQVSEYLNQYATVICAENGQLGLNQALSTMPDLIITDLVMPQINGIELTKKIRETDSHKHIPILMLTGQNFETVIKNAYQAGISDFIAKPFDQKILLLKIINILKLRSAIQYMTQISTLTETELPETVEKSLVSEIINFVNAQDDFNNISVETVAYHLNMSKSTLIRHLKNETDKAPSEIINDVRFEKAKQMLESGKMTISEIAWKLGFTEVKYFRKKFKAQFGVTPNEFKGI
ncbi:MAG: response regulator [Bacteroidales bacterium]|nr:response regulator [Bacteroidales bacterium]